VQADGTALLELFADGGVMMYPLLGCSLLALGVILGKAYTLWQAGRWSRGVAAAVLERARAGDLAGATRLAASAPGPVAALLHAGLRRAQDPGAGDADIEQALRSAGSAELGFLERGLAALATIANVAPLIGFLGTVAGMISAFGAIAAAGEIEPRLVAGGIKVALITTAAGLLVAVPSNLAYNYFVTRLDRLMVEMERASAALLAVLWDRAREARRPRAVAAGGPGADPAGAGRPAG